MKNYTILTEEFFRNFANSMKPEKGQVIDLIVICKNRKELKKIFPTIKFNKHGKEQSGTTSTLNETAS